MAKAGLSLMVAMVLGGCAGAQDAGPGTPPAVAQGPCRDAALARFIGQSANAQTGADMLQASGATSLRWGGPGMAMTMDYRADRLTVGYDAAMVITSARCG